MIAAGLSTRKDLVREHTTWVTRDGVTLGSVHRVRKGSYFVNSRVPGKLCADFATEDGAVNWLGREGVRRHRIPFDLPLLSHPVTVTEEPVRGHSPDSPWRDVYANGVLRGHVGPSSAEELEWWASPSPGACFRARGCDDGSRLFPARADAVRWLTGLCWEELCPSCVDDASGMPHDVTVYRSGLVIVTRWGPGERRWAEDAQIRHGVFEGDDPLPRVRAWLRGYGWEAGVWGNEGPDVLVAGLTRVASETP